MSKDTLEIGKVIEIDQVGLKNQLGEVVRSTVEETLNGLLDAEADRICGAQAPNSNYVYFDITL